ncbi:MAG: glutamate--tRNA ligase family protein [Promethearchaeota archaeon]|jgi:glutamyl-tRNA synthetase
MADDWKPSKEETNIIYSFALQNCLEHGQAQIGSIMGRLSKNFDMKKYGRLLPRYVIGEVNRANSLMQKSGEEAVREELMKIDSSKIERLEREKTKIERTFPELSNVEQGNFKVRFAPNPNAPLTVGHMRGVLINNYYANKYGGDFILRFDDTSTDVKPPILDAYVQILKDTAWLTGKAPDDVIIASDRIDIYYKYAKELISLNGAYMCNCKNFKELKDASIPCPHRKLTISENLDLFNRMIDGDFEAGEWVLRAKTDLDAPNPAHRDFVLFRVQRNAHPRTGDSYKAWPMLDFQSAIDDNLTGVTHVIRGIDLQDSTAKQKILYNFFDWEYPETTYWGRVKILDQDGNEVRFSSSQYAKDIAEGKFTGWDDERLYTVQAFKNRGYTSDALLEWWLEYGLTRKPITVSMKTLDTLQRRKKEMSAEEFNAINVSNTTLSTYGSKRHRKFDHKQSKRHDYGSADCVECGEPFLKDHPQRKYCYGECASIVKARQIREYNRKRRANMTDEELEERNRKQREGRRERRANMTEEEKEEYNRKQREWSRKRMANQTDEEKEKDRIKWREYARKKMANWTDEEKEEYNRKQREYSRKRWARGGWDNRTDEEKEEFKRKMREKWANRTNEQNEERKRKRREKYANMTKEEKEEYNRKQREYSRKRRASMTDEEKEEIKRKKREDGRKRRANRTDEEREEYNRKKRERRARKREMGAENVNSNIPSDYYKTYGKKGAVIRFKIKEKILKEKSMGTKAGQWSARKSQKLKQKYEEAMKKKSLKPYVSSKKTGKQKDLKNWGDQSWGTKSGGKSSVTGEPYFPKKAVEALKKKKLYAKAKRQKVAATKKGKQYASYSPDIKKVVAQYRAEDDTT